MGRTMAVVLFTDLVGSTELRARVGEEAAEGLRRMHDRLLAQAVEANSGRVVKGLGDGIMATFAGVSDAVAAAVAIQRSVHRLNRSPRRWRPWRPGWDLDRGRDHGRRRRSAGARHGSGPPLRRLEPTAEGRRRIPVQQTCNPWD